MEYYVEKRNPAKDLGGLCECFIADTQGPRTVAQLHVHRYFELLYCLSGSFELRAEHQVFTLRPGDVALIHPMEPHQTRSLELDKNSYLVLKFMPDALYAASQPLFELKYIVPYLHFSAQRAYVYTASDLSDSGLGSLLLRILEERSLEEYGYEMALRAYVSEVLLWFLRAWNHARAATPFDERTLLRLQSALAYIDAHLDEPLNVSDVADALSMGVSTFSRFFSDAAGTSFPAYVRARRLNRASLLLVESSKSITDIALETGFSSASYLILCFRREYGVTPHHFRRLYSGGSAP